MAVRKVEKQEVKTEEVKKEEVEVTTGVEKEPEVPISAEPKPEVEEGVDALVTEIPVEEEDEIPVEEEIPAQETEVPVIEVPVVEIPVEDTDKNVEVEVDIKASETAVSGKVSGNVKIRMRVDHKCCIAMERYDLKAGKVYTVPENVKNILNKAGLLAPL